VAYLGFCEGDQSQSREVRGAVGANGVECGEGVSPPQKLKKNFGSMCSKIFCVQAKGGGIAQSPPKYATGPADATAIPKPHCLLPHLNPDWFYLSGTGLA